MKNRYQIEDILFPCHISIDSNLETFIVRMFAVYCSCIAAQLNNLIDLYANVNIIQSFLMSTSCPYNISLITCDKKYQQTHLPLYVNHREICLSCLICSSFVP